MVSRLSGSVTAAAVQKRVMVTVPQSQAYGVYSKAESVIRLHPDWTEDQVTAEVLKAFTPASAGGQLILPQSYVDLQARKTMLAVGAVVLLVGVVILSSRKRRRA